MVLPISGGGGDGEYGDGEYGVDCMLHEKDNTIIM